MKLLHRIFPLAIGLTTANCPVAAVGTEKPNVTLKFMKMHKAYILLVLSTVIHQDNPSTNQNSTL